MNIAFQLVMGDISIVPTINSIDGETIDGSNFHCKALMGNISIVPTIDSIDGFILSDIAQL